MKKRFNARSAFFNPRVLAGFFICLGGALLALVTVSLYFSPAAVAQKRIAGEGRAGVSARPEVIPMIGPISQDRDLRSLPYFAPNEENEETRLMRHPYFTSRGTQDPIRAIRQAATVAAMPTPIATYPGISSAQSGCGCLPPDTHGDVGPNHYIQSVNSSIKITDKSGNTLSGPTTYNSFFAPMGPTTPCGANQNDGDGFVFYDHLADRWVVSDFAFPAFPGVSFYQCVGVSKTSDPVSGGWYLYAVQVDPNNPNYLGDYPKFGLWPDAYYFSVNLFSNNTTFNGVRVFALPRNDLINGTSGPNGGAIAFTIDPSTLGDAYSLVPGTFRTGSNPPAGRPEYFLAVDSPSADVVQTKVHVWRFHADFTTPANSTFGVGANHAPDGDITVAGFVDAYTTTTLIVPQNGTTRKLDTLGDKLMTPLVYQNLGGTESLWVSQTVNNNNNGTGPTGIRWYQFDFTGDVIPANPVQQQTFTNGGDGLWRWMPSISLDANGNMAIGYTVSSATSEPSIRYAGRLASDPLGTLAQGEAIMQAGGGHQTSSSGRWGDYSGLGIDPSDNLTFWHTNEYYSATSGAAWNTRIGKFKFPVAPVPVSAVSRKTHGGAGTFDINLPLTGNPGIEDRTGATPGDHTIIVNFAVPVTVTAASVSSGTGTASSYSVSGSQVTVNLTGVSNNQYLTIKLSTVSDGTNVGDVYIRAGFLLGDVTQSGGVNATDVSETKTRSGANTDGTNFQYDVNTSGQVNATDVSVVKTNSGNNLPTP